MQTLEQKESWIVKHGLAIIIISMITSVILSLIAILVATSAGMTLTPVMTSEECLPIHIGILSPIQFMCP